MIIKSNNNVYKNYFGEDNVSKVYAGENLVFGKEDPNKKAHRELWFYSNKVDDYTLQGGIGNGSVTIQSSERIETAVGTAMAMEFKYGAENTITISGINNITKVEVKMRWVSLEYSPYNGNTVISTGELTHNQEEGYSLWTFNGSTATITFNNTYRDPLTKQYVTYVNNFDITVYYLEQ